MSTPLIDDGSRFTRLLLQHQRQVYAYILSLLPNAPEADDVLQDTCEVLWRKFSEFEPGTNFVAWANSVARVKVLERVRLQKRGPASLAPDVITLLAEESIVDSEDFEQRHIALGHCISQLPPRSRQMLHERYANGLTVRQIAQHARISHQAVSKALRRIHEALLNCINRALSEGEAKS